MSKHSELAIDETEMTAAAFVDLILLHPDITLLVAENLHLFFDPTTDPPPTFELLQLNGLIANVQPSLLSFLALLPPKSIPKLQVISLRGRLFKRDFMAGFTQSGEEEIEEFGRTHGNVADFMETYGEQLQMIDASELGQVTTSDINSLKRLVPGAEDEWNEEQGDIVPESSEWEWDDEEKALVRD
ncbi:hypothetical protein P7C70_g2348, partial [Phenoliferia sp. Uapishka_3]